MGVSFSPRNRTGAGHGAGAQLCYTVWCNPGTPHLWLRHLSSEDCLNRSTMAQHLVYIPTGEKGNRRQRGQVPAFYRQNQVKSSFYYQRKGEHIVKENWLSQVTVTQEIHSRSVMSLQIFLCSTNTYKIPPYVRHWALHWESSARRLQTMDEEMKEPFCRTAIWRYGHENFMKANNLKYGHK